MLFYKSVPLLAEAVKTFVKKKHKKGDYRQFLTDESTPLFNFLRDWRNKLAIRQSHMEAACL